MSSQPTEDLVDADTTPTAPNVGLLGSTDSVATDHNNMRLQARGSTIVPPTTTLDLELKDSLQPLPRGPRERMSMRSHRLVNAQSDDNDSAVSMVCQRE